jgi:hypothetical protein
MTTTIDAIYEDGAVMAKDPQIRRELHGTNTLFATS